MSSLLHATLLVRNSVCRENFIINYVITTTIRLAMQPTLVIGESSRGSWLSVHLLSFKYFIIIMRVN